MIGHDNFRFTVFDFETVIGAEQTGGQVTGQKTEILIPH
jgi:hypothetical protein